MRILASCHIQLSSAVEIEAYGVPTPEPANLAEPAGIS